MTIRAFRDAGDGYYQIDIADGESAPSWTAGLFEVVPCVSSRPPITREQVNEERDRRIAAGFEFGGKHFAFDPPSKARISGGATLAGFAMAQGAQPGNLRWHGGTTDFEWISDDNSLLPMDAQTCFLFGQVAAAHETAHIFAARAVKDMDPIPEDYTDGKYWP